MACAICTVRRPRRECPGVHGDICGTCCGESREVTVACPLDCEYLIEARRHEQPSHREQSKPEEIPNRDIQVTEKLLVAHESLLAAIAGAIAEAALNTAGVVDSDVREAIDALIRTYRTLTSGIYYDTRPANPLAGVVYDSVQGAVDRFRQWQTEQTGLHQTGDGAVLAMLAFLQRLELDCQNGRPRGRAFIHSIAHFHGGGPEPEAAASSPLILP